MGFLTDYSFLIRTLLFFFYLNSKWLLNLWKCDHFNWNAFVHFVRMLRLFVAISIHLIQLEYMSVKMRTDVSLFRVAPPARQNPEPPPPPPPPPEAWQAVMAATNANTQLIMQILQECNQGHGNNQNQFATLNQFLANQPKTFSNCVEATNSDDWLVDI